MRKLVIPFALLFSFGLIGCGQSVTVKRTSLVPAAAAEAKVSQDNNHNSVIELAVERLAPPQNLTPPRKTYLVWAEGREGKRTLLGQLRIDKNGAGNFRATTPMGYLRLVITAEDGMEADAPGKQMVLSTDFFAVK